MVPVFDRKAQLILILILATLLFGGGVKYGQIRDRNKEVFNPELVSAQINEETNINESTPRELAVHVIGAVTNPGVYELPVGSRVIDVVKQANPLPEADLQGINLAEPLNDGQQVIVPHKGEGPHELVGMASSTTNRQGKLNINMATIDELDSCLPGVGPALAQRIVNYREKHGKFRSIDDLKNVSGIGEKRFSELKDLITVY